MTTEAGSTGADIAPFATPTREHIATGIAQIEAELALAASSPPAAEPADYEPWVLDHSDDEWTPSKAVGQSAFSRRARATPLLSADQEIVLARRIEAGALAQERLDAGIELRRTQRRGLEHVVREGDEAREQMILANVRLVTSIARKSLPRTRHGMTFDDVQQAGLIGLMHAVTKFDHSLGNKFSTYATWWIRQSISRAIDNDSRIIRLPVHALDSARRIDTHRQSNGLTWSEALADPARLGTDVTTSDVTRARNHLRLCLSLDEVVEAVDLVDPDETTLDTVLERAGFDQWWSAASEYLELLPGLGARGTTILELRFGLRGDGPMTLDQIGQQFGVTRERIRQIERKALEALRDWDQTVNESSP